MTNLSPESQKKDRATGKKPLTSGKRSGGGKRRNDLKTADHPQASSSSRLDSEGAGAPLEKERPQQIQKTETEKTPRKPSNMKRQPAAFSFARDIHGKGSCDLARLGFALFKRKFRLEDLVRVAELAGVRMTLEHARHVVSGYAALVETLKLTAESSEGDWRYFFSLMTEGKALEDDDSEDEAMPVLYEEGSLVHGALQCVSSQLIVAEQADQEVSTDAPQVRDGGAPSVGQSPSGREAKESIWDGYEEMLETDEEVRLTPEEYRLLTNAKMRQGARATRSMKAGMSVPENWSVWAMDAEDSAKSLSDFYLFLEAVSSTKPKTWKEVLNCSDFDFRTGYMFSPAWAAMRSEVTLGLQSGVPAWRSVLGERRVESPVASATIQEQVFGWARFEGSLLHSVMRSGPARTLHCGLYCQVALQEVRGFFDMEPTFPCPPEAIPEPDPHDPPEGLGPDPFTGKVWFRNGSALSAAELRALDSQVEAKASAFAAVVGGVASFYGAKLAMATAAFLRASAHFVRGAGNIWEIAQNAASLLRVLARRPLREAASTLKFSTQGVSLSWQARLATVFPMPVLDDGATIQTEDGVSNAVRAATQAGRLVRASGQRLVEARTGLNFPARLAEAAKALLKFKWVPGYAALIGAVLAAYLTYRITWYVRRYGMTCFDLRYVHLTYPRGTFVGAPADEVRPAAMRAGDTSFTPMVSFFRTALHEPTLFGWSMRGAQVRLFSSTLFSSLTCPRIMPAQMVGDDAAIAERADRGAGSAQYINGRNSSMEFQNTTELARLVAAQRFNTTLLHRARPGFRGYPSSG